MARWLFPLLLLPAVAPPLEVAIDPRPGEFFTATFSFSASGLPPGQFRGSVALNGSPAEVPLAGRGEKIGGRTRLRATLRYADVPAGWLNRCRQDSFDYRLQGEVEGSARVSWSGTMRWDQVTVERGGEAVSRFARLASLELTALSLGRSEGRAVLEVENPFSFPIEIAGASYDLRVHGRSVGGGAARGSVLRAKRRDFLELPFTVDHGRFLAAAGSAWAAGAELDAELRATLTLRLVSGELSIPVTLRGRMGTDGARSGVFSLPEGSTSLSPDR